MNEELEKIDFNTEDLIGLSVDELKLTVEGKQISVDRDKIIKAFPKAELTDFSGKFHRYYVRIDGDMRSVISVFNVICPVERDLLTESVVHKIATVFRTLGFEVLDSRSHHGK